jgi:hypothetical protein
VKAWDAQTEEVSIMVMSMKVTEQELQSQKEELADIEEGLPQGDN